MANKKITDLGLLTAPASGDLAEVVDVSDTSDSADGSSRQVTLSNIITKAHGLADSTVVGIASGVLTSGVDVAVADGGTGASDAAGARTNLGLVIGTNVQAYNSLLADIAAITFSQGDVIYFNGTNLVRLAAGTNGYFLKTQGAGANPVWAQTTGQSVVTRIVASSGGDHTTLGAAIAAASDGDTIWVRNGTYNESSITSSLAGITIIGESREGVIINLGTTTCTLSGADVKIDNLRVNVSTGSLVMSGANWSLHGVDLISSGNAQHLLLSGANGKMVDCYYYDGTSSYTTGAKVSISGKGSLISSCYFSILNATGSLTKPSVELNGQFITVSSCTFRSRGGGTNGPIVGTKTTNALYCSINGCTLENDSAVFDTGISLYGNYNTVTGCAINNAYYAVYVGDPYNVISSNTIVSSQAGNSIDIGAANTVVVGNMIRSSVSTGSGIKIDGAFDDCVITGNFVYQTNNGIWVSNSGADRTVIVGNTAISAGTNKYYNQGTNTIMQGNNGAGDAYQVNVMTDGATVTPNCDNGTMNTVTLGGNRTMAAPSGTPREGQTLILRIRQDATGSRTISSWNSIYRFPAATAPTLTTTAAKTDYLTFVYNSTDSKWDMISSQLNL